MIRRYSMVLLLTSVAGTLQGSEAKAAYVAPAPVSFTASSPISNAPVPPSTGALLFSDRAIIRGGFSPADLDRVDAKVSRVIPEVQATEIRFPGAFAPTARTLRALGLKVEPVFKGMVANSPAVEACLAPGCAAPQWHHAATVAPAGWQSPPPASPIQVAVLDTRIDTSHPDWIRNGGTGPDVAQGGQLLTALTASYVTNHSGAAAYHGTFVAGLLAAASNNSDMIGVATRSVAIAPYAVVDGGGNTDSSALAAALIKSWRDGARIINLSLGVLGNSTTLHDALKLVTRGDAVTPAALVVAAAGNNTGNAAFYPGSYAESLSVSGTAADDTAASCSNFNSNVSVSAPADRLVGLAPMPQRLLQAPCGTSAAAPQVSGLAAMLLAQDPSRTPAELRAIIENSADDLGASGRDDRFGHGRINIARALGAASTARVDRFTTIVASKDSEPSIEVTARTDSGSISQVTATIGGRDFNLAASDGNFNSSVERAKGTIDLKGLTPGVHRVLVTAQDAEGRGAPASGVVVIDSTAPVISNIEAPNTIRAASTFVVRFNAADALSNTVISGVQIRGTGTGATASASTNWTPNGSQSVSIGLPTQLPPGHYTVTVAVADPSGNVARAEVGTVIV